MSSAHIFKINRMDSQWRIVLSLYLFLISCAVTKDYAIATVDVISHPCDTIHCPPLADLICPEDSELRDADEKFTPIHDRKVLNLVQQEINISKIMDELFAMCCLQSKCICKTCYIPDCFNRNEVVIELVAESMNIPGYCCGSYKCNQEPNCTVALETDEFWLTNCKRCRCFLGERICHLNCEESIRKSNGICNSVNLNTFFEHGETWKDGCYECECVNGEVKCVMPFCRSLNCPPNRQVTQKNSCCPICWPMGVSMPNEEEYNDGDSVRDTQSVLIEEEDPVTQNNNNNNNNNNNFDDRNNRKILIKQKETSMNNQTILSATTQNNYVEPNNQMSTATSPPCTVNVQQKIPATYQVYPEVIEVVRESNQNGIYIIIGVLVLGILALVIWNFHLRAKQRSYRPVCHFDDNFNKTAPHVKKKTDECNSV